MPQLFFFFGGPSVNHGGAFRNRGQKKIECYGLYCVNGEANIRVTD